MSRRRRGSGRRRHARTGLIADDLLLMVVPGVVVVAVVASAFVVLNWLSSVPEPTAALVDLADPPPTIATAPDRPLGAPDPSGATDTDFVFIATQEGSSEPVRWDPCSPIRYVVNPDGAPAAGDRLLEEAIASVSSASGLQFEYVGETDEGWTEDRPPFTDPASTERNPVRITWSTERTDPNLGGNVVGWSGPTSVSFGGAPRWHVSGVVDLDAEDLGDILRTSDGEAIVRAVIQHELGHLVGLGHVEDPTELMYPSTNDAVDWGPGDRAGLRRLGTGPCAAAANS